MPYQSVQRIEIETRSDPDLEHKILRTLKNHVAKKLVDSNRSIPQALPKGSA